MAGQLDEVKVPFPLDEDLKPLIGKDGLDYWQAMTITTCRKAAEVRDRLNSVEGLLKKVVEGTQESPKTLKGITLAPDFRS